MENLEEVVKERNRAYYELEVGITGIDIIFCTYGLLLNFLKKLNEATSVFQTHFHVAFQSCSMFRSQLNHYVIHSTLVNNNPTLNCKLNSASYYLGERDRFYRRDGLGRYVPYKPVEHSLPAVYNAPYRRRIKNR